MDSTLGPTLGLALALALALESETSIPAAFAVRSFAVLPAGSAPELVG
jgi:hypothetical protein